MLAKIDNVKLIFLQVEKNPLYRLIKTFVFDTSNFDSYLFVSSFDFLFDFTYLACFHLSKISTLEKNLISIIFHNPTGVRENLHH